MKAATANLIAFGEKLAVFQLVLGLGFGKLTTRPLDYISERVFTDELKSFSNVTLGTQ